MLPPQEFQGTLDQYAQQYGGQQMPSSGTFAPQYQQPYYPQYQQPAYPALPPYPGKTSLMKSRKFRVMLVDMGLSTVSYLVAKFVLPSIGDTILWLIGAWQPAIFAVIMGIAQEDVAYMAATATQRALAPKAFVEAMRYSAPNTAPSNANPSSTSNTMAG